MTMIRFSLSVALVCVWPAWSLATDRKAYHAMTTCRYFLRNQVPEFEGLPGEAVKVEAGAVTEAGVHIIDWSVRWDNPTVNAAGHCRVRGNEIIGYETRSPDTN